MSLKIQYNNIAEWAKYDFVPRAKGGLDISNITLMNDDEANFPRYDVPFELNSFSLDGAARFLPENEKAQIAYISEQLSGEDGVFSTPIVFTFTSEQLYSSIYSSVGLTFVFDEEKNVYATDMVVKWYLRGELVDQASFNPTSTRFFCNKSVNAYDEIVCEFYAINLPFARFRINKIRYGYSIEFGSAELRSVKTTQQIDILSESIPISTFDFELDSKQAVNFSFLRGQHLDLVNNGKIEATMIVNSAKNKGKGRWSVRAEDYISVLDGVEFYGDVYSNKDARELITEIFSKAKVPCEVSPDILQTVSGHIPRSSCRDALLQIAIAIGAVISTQGGGVVKVGRINSEKSQDLPKRRIKQEGASNEIGSKVTDVELTYHTYSESSLFDTEGERVTVYSSKTSGAAEGLYIPFAEPLYSLTISDGEIIESTANYAIINIGENGSLRGFKYLHSETTITAQNPEKLTGDVYNVVSINGAYLINENNAEQRLSEISQIIFKPNTSRMHIIDTQQDPSTTVGDVIGYELEDGEYREGIIVRQTYNYGSGMIDKDSEVIG